MKVNIDPNTWNCLQHYVLEWSPAIEETKTRDQFNDRGKNL